MKEMETGLQWSQNRLSSSWKEKEKKINCFITERSRGIASWIRFGGEGMIKLLAGVEECSRVFDSARKPFEWKENDRYYRLESKVKPKCTYEMHTCQRVDYSMIVHTSNSLIAMDSIVACRCNWYT